MASRNASHIAHGNKKLKTAREENNRKGDKERSLRVSHRVRWSNWRRLIVNGQMANGEWRMANGEYRDVVLRLVCPIFLVCVFTYCSERENDSHAEPTREKRADGASSPTAGSVLFVAVCCSVLGAVATLDLQRNRRSVGRRRPMLERKNELRLLWRRLSTGRGLSRL
jgi:hypothetical protein